MVATSLVAGPGELVLNSFRLHRAFYRRTRHARFSQLRAVGALHADTCLGEPNHFLEPSTSLNWNTDVSRPPYRLRCPYKHLRSFVKKNKSVICFFSPDGFGFYNQKHEPILFPKMDLVRYHVNHDEPQVIFITEKDVLNHLTRAQCRGSEHVFIGVKERFPSGADSRLRRIIGRRTFWSRTLMQAYGYGYTKWARRPTQRCDTRRFFA